MNPIKRILLCLMLLTNYAIAQVKNGDTVPDIRFTAILNAPVKEIKLSQMNGKVVIIEFWATWCGACLEAMPHLKQLQEKYKGKLQVIAVTQETAKRAGQYIVSRPSNLWFDADTGDIAKLFPHQLIPHTVLIGPDGELIAATSPESVTGPVIDSIWNHQQVHLPEKTDQLLGPDELIKNYFFAADTVKNRLMMQPEIKGAPGFSTTYLNNPAFKGRRITAVNCGLTNLYSLAFGGFPYSRIIDNSHDTDHDHVYCLDLIVAEKSDLLPALQKELLKRFDVQCRIDTQIKMVDVLKITDRNKFKKIALNISGTRTYAAGHGTIDQQGITMADLAEYLENYGSGRLTVDETGNHQKFDLKFSFQPENPASLVKVLSDMGLELKKEQHNISMLVLYE